MGRLFGTDGARGIAVTELTCELAMNIGRAAAIVLTKHCVDKKAKILIGKDTRISSDVLEAALISGVTSVGADAILLGVVPTPAVAYLVKHYGADAGIMISASHNTVEYNGIKLFSANGFKLPDEVEEEIESFILDNPSNMKNQSGINLGRIFMQDSAVDTYNKHLLETISLPLKPLKIAVDCANGSACSTAEKLFNSLNLPCIFIGNNPDGTNINKNCGSTHLELLRQVVLENKCDLGLAFDGDADRCLAIDNNGNEVNGDKLIAILSLSMKHDGKLNGNTAVATVMSNLGFHRYMKKNNINVVCTKVGDRYVLEEMIANGYSIGGEQSGHIIFSEYATTGDGQLTALQLLSLLSKTEKSLSELVSEISDFPQILVGVKMTDNTKSLWKESKKVQLAIEAAKEELGENGRVLVRESGTEPLVRIMLEGADYAQIQRLTTIIEKEVKSLIER